MIIFNASFIIEHSKEEAFKAWITDRRGWFRGVNRAEIRPSASAPSEIRISALRATGGVEQGAIDSHTISIQSSFATMADGKRWEEEIFTSIAESFYATFAPNAMIFTSYFETIDIDL